MKRHSSFVPLSRDHHDGLLLAMRLQQGRKALLRLWSHDPHWQLEYVVKFFDDNLDLHFRIEEEILFPVAQQHLTQHADLIRRLLTEHGEMRNFVELFRHPSHTSMESSLTKFGEVLERHIRAEERELFPLCEEHIPAGILDELGKRIRHREQEGA